MNKKNLFMINIVILFTLNIIILFLFFDLSHFNIRVPLVPRGDGYGFLATVKMIISGDFPWYLYPSSELLGAPYGFNLADYPMPMFLDWVFIKFLSFFSSDPIVVFNLYILSSHFLVPLSAYVVMRKLRVMPLLAIVISLLYNYLPFHYWRMTHTLYVGYFFIPIWTYYLLLLWNKKPIFFKYNNDASKYKLDFSKKNIIIIILLILSSTWNYYYSFFFAFLLFIAGVSAWTFTRNRYTIISSMLMIIFIALPIVVNMLPNKIYTMQHGKNTSVAKRSPAESETYALKITQLLLPVEGHRIDAIAEFKERYNHSPLVNENHTATLGAIGSIGLLLLLFVILSKRYKNTIHNRLSILATGAILFATIGGFSSLFALLITPSIRGYNRISVFIAFFALLAFALLLNKYLSTIKKYYLYTILFVLLTVGLLDQIPKNMTFKSTNYNIKKLQSNKKFISDIEQMENNVTKPMVIQYPYMYYPEHGPINGLASYDQFDGYIYGNKIRWSYGAVAGRKNNDWLLRTTREPLKREIKILKSSGFTGIYIDRSGYADYGLAFEADLEKLLHIKPLISDDKTKSFFPLEATGDHIFIFMYFTEGFYRWERGKNSFGWTKGNARLQVANNTKNTEQYRLSFVLGTLKERNVVLQLNGKILKTIHLMPGKSESLSLVVELPPNASELIFTTDTAAALPGNKDKRKLAFSVADLKLTMIEK